MDEAEAGAAVVMCYKCHNTATRTRGAQLQIMLATHQVRSMRAHQHLHDTPNPRPVVATTDTDVGVAMQDSNDHSCL
jgi:hypothetical protein